MSEPQIHESSYVDEGAEIGEGTRIWHYCHVMGAARIGRECTLGQGVFVGKGVLIGDGVKIENHVSVFSGVTIEDEVFVGPSATFTNVLTPRSALSRRDEFVPTLVKRGASFGANVTIVCGITIGRYALVGAGAVVTRDVADYALVYGVPAEHRGWVCRCGARLSIGDDDQTSCDSCGRKFASEGGLVAEIDEDLA